MKEIIDELMRLKITIKSHGGQLKIEGPKEKLTPNIVDKIRANKEELIAYLDTAKSKEYLLTDIPKIESDLNQGYVLSSSQKRVWLLSKLHEIKDSFYNINSIYTVNGDLDKDILQFSLNVIIQKHEILRTIFIKNSSGEIRQRVQNFKESLYKMSFYDFMGESKNEEKIKRILQDNMEVKFDLTNAPLFKLKVVRIDDKEYVVSLVMHHIISDGWSQDIIMKELLENYNDYANGNIPNKKSLNVQYKDYSDWQQSLIGGQSFLQSKKYWLSQFEGELPVLNLPYDFRHPPLRTGKGGVVSSRIDSEELIKLKALANEMGTTLFSVLLTLVKMLLFRYNDQKDLIVGIPVAGREHHQLESQIGLYVNLLALRTKINGTESFKDLINVIGKKISESYENQVYPFDELIDELKLKRNVSRNPLFDVTVSLKNEEKTNFNDSLNIEVKEYKNIESIISRYDLSLNFNQDNEGISFSIEYNADVFVKQTIERLLIHFKELLSSALSNPNKQFTSLNFLSKNERQNILEVFNETDINYPSKTSLSILDEIVKNQPKNIAVLDETDQITYKELNELSESFAEYLLKECNLSPGKKVGVFMDKSVGAIITIIGILKANLVYVPINPNDAKERIKYIAEDAVLNLICLDVQSQKKLSSIIERDSVNSLVLSLEKIRELPLTQKISRPDIESLAYIIYTSGSTGRPKGVMVGHEGLVNISFDHRDRLQINEQDHVLQFIPFSFDGSVLDIFMTLLSGATMVLPNDRILGDKNLFSKFIEKNKVSIASFTPSYLRFLSKDTLPSVKTIISAGESIDFDITLHYFDLGKEVYNAYGPTETTVNATLYKIKRSDLVNNNEIPIGKPSANKKIIILDDNMQLLPYGIVGELYICGNGLARGYLNNSDLTSEKFIDNPFEKNTKMYKTGDLGFWLPDGMIIYKGRKDSQIKVRGYRVELGEIENAIDSYEAIEKSVVLDRVNKKGEKELIAYFVPSKKEGFTIGKIIDTKQNLRADEINLFELPNGFTLFSNTQSELKLIYEEVIKDNAYLRNGIHIPEGGCVLDIGANVGLFSIYINSIVKDLKIYAFEPLPTTFSYLEKNTSLYQGDIKAFNYGLSDKEEIVSFLYYPYMTAMSSRYIDKEQGRQNVKDFVLGSEGFDLKEINEYELNSLIEERLVSERYDCQLKTISNVIQENKIDKIDLLKIDVEQAELDVLNGIKYEDWSKIEQVIVEVHDIEGRLSIIENKLKEAGFTIHIEQYGHLSSSNMYNLFARKPEVPNGPNLIEQNNNHLFGLNAFQSELKNYLIEQLPTYMIPSHFREMKEFPLINGKINRNLIAKNNSLVEFETEYFPPVSRLEHKLVKIWSDVLDIDTKKIGIKDDFFNLGGNSLSAMRVVSKIHEQLETEIDLSEFFKNSKIEFIAKLINAEKQITKI